MGNRFGGKRGGQFGRSGWAVARELRRARAAAGKEAEGEGRRVSILTPPG
jgi:hypothetical protein